MTWNSILMKSHDSCLLYTSPLAPRSFSSFFIGYWCDDKSNDKHANTYNNAHVLPFSKVKTKHYINVFSLNWMSTINKFRPCDLAIISASSLSSIPEIKSIQIELDIRCFVCYSIIAFFFHCFDFNGPNLSNCSMCIFSSPPAAKKKKRK